MHPAVALTIDLIPRPSVTPDAAGCHHALQEALHPSRFQFHDYSCNEVENLLATHGTGAPVIMFAGHCDVVPPGPLDAWQTHPFEPEISGGKIYGRGAADMKSGLAAMTIALAKYAKDHPDHPGTLALLSTSDEEGAGVDGTKHVLNQLAQQGLKIDFALVGEPTSEQLFGDMIKVGRRGSLTGYMTVQGIQGHVAYPQLAQNPIHQLLPFLNALKDTVFDNGNEVFPPTSLQIANFQSGTGAVNVIPGIATLDFNIRYSPESSAESLMQQVEDLAAMHNLDAEFTWNHSAKAFQTHCELLTNAIHNAVENVTGVSASLGTTGGTSDARFFADHQIPVIEFGPLNKTIHAANECVLIQEVEKLADIFYQTIDSLVNP